MHQEEKAQMKPFDFRAFVLPSLSLYSWSLAHTRIILNGMRWMTLFQALIMQGCRDMRSLSREKLLD